jgi:shikimate dehydrogenase
MSDARHWSQAQPGDFAVVGDPVAHSWSPALHAAAYKELGLELTYRAVQVPLEEFVPAMERLAGIGYRGVNVTLPLKETAASWATPEDPRLGAVNVVDLGARTARNTDVPAFLASIAGLRPGRALVLGAGGSARGLAFGLVDAGWELVGHNRTRARLDALVHQHGLPIRPLDRPDPTGCSLVINATSASLVGLSPEVDWQAAESGALAYDLAYGRGPTPFLVRAAEHGLRTQDGLEMLVRQAALSVEWWLGEAPDLGAMREAVSWPS